MFIPDIDKRLAKWPLMENANKTALIVLAYLLFIKLIGPAWMRNRKPYQLRLPMILYNFAMVIFSSWMFYKFGKHGWFHKYSWKCQPVDYYSEDEDGMGMVEVCWYFFISKIIELADTVFFVLRKKDSQISALHVIHHSVVPLTARFAISRGAAGYNIFFGFANTFVHIWMYLYYALAAVGPSVHKYLWWKKYLTTLQMTWFIVGVDKTDFMHLLNGLCHFFSKWIWSTMVIQFCIVFIVMTAHTINPNCETNAILILVSLGQAIFFFVLFAHFYVESYKKKTKTDLPPKNDSAPEEKNSQFTNGNSSQVRHRSYIEINDNENI